jgi:hypothetical protein
MLASPASKPVAGHVTMGGRDAYGCRGGANHASAADRPQAIFFPKHHLRRNDISKIKFQNTFPDWAFGSFEIFLKKISALGNDF